jgi:hypothetical protein
LCYILSSIWLNKPKSGCKGNDWRGKRKMEN